MVSSTLTNVGFLKKHMGNKESKTSEVDGEDEEGNADYLQAEGLVRPVDVKFSDVKYNKLSPAQIQRLRSCLSILPLAKTDQAEKAFEKVTKHIVVQEYEAGQDILLKGSKSRGIFVIDEGCVDVVSADGSHVLANLREGDLFGEVSVLYGVPCTARVTTSNTCRLLLVEVKLARKLFRRVTMDMMDWFVTRRYLPTADDMDRDRVVRRMVFTCLRELPVFADWSDLALKGVVLQLTPALIVLYPANSVIAMHGDPPVVLNVLIRGRLVIKDRTDTVMAEVCAQEDSVVIGEQGVLLGMHSEVTVQSITCCEIIPVREEYIQDIVTKHPRDAGAAWRWIQTKWAASLARNNITQQKYPARLQFEVVFQMMKASEVFSKCSASCVYEICLRGLTQDHLPSEYVCTQDEYGADTFVLLLKGECELITYPEMSFEYTLKAGQVFCCCDWMEQRGELVAISPCIVVKVTQSDVFTAVTSSTNSVITYPTEPQFIVP